MKTTNRYGLRHLGIMVVLVALHNKNCAGADGAGVLYVRQWGTLG